MKADIDLAINGSFRRMASAQRQLAVSYCGAMAAKNPNPSAWIREVFANVAVRLDAASVEPRVKEEAKTQVSLIADQLLSEVTVQRDAA